MKALERLTLAFFYDDAVPSVFGDLTAADGAGWQDGVVENAALFERFAVLTEALEEKRRILADMGDDVPPDKIRSFLSSLAAEFLDFSDLPQAKMAIETSLTAVTEALKRTLGRDAKVAPDVLQSPHVPMWRKRRRTEHRRASRLPVWRRFGDSPLKRWRSWGWIGGALFRD